MEIKIGADELILWLRKNNIANKKTTQELGKRVLKLIESVGGRLTVHDEPCYWNTDPSSESIDEYKLPKTASQYLVDISRISDLYLALYSWD